jgi:hypothetical protein
MGLEPLCDNNLCLSVILKTLTLTGQEFLEVQEKMEITGSEVRTPAGDLLSVEPCVA